VKSGYLKKKEKTSNRIPFPIFLASCVEMRYMPNKRLGDCPQLRVERTTETIHRPCLGKAKHCVFRMSEIRDYKPECLLFGAFQGLEAIWGRHCELGASQSS
jgi:hypothetical protein